MKNYYSFTLKVEHFLNKKNTLLIISAIYCILAILAIKQSNPIGDERNYHLPNAISFYNNGVIDGIFGDGYSVANTPIPYIINTNFFLFEPSLISVRLTTLLFSFTTVILIYLIFLQLTLSRLKSLLIALIFLFYPYFIRQSVLFHAPIYGLFFLFLFLYLHINSTTRNNLNSFLYGLLLSVALLSQQFFIAFAASFSIEYYKKGKVSYRDFIFFCLPFVVPIAVFLGWGGLSHPNFRAHGIKFDITHFSAIFTILGFNLFVFTTLFLKSLLLKRNLILIAIAVIFALFFSPEHSSGHGEGMITGFTFSVLAKINNINPLFSKLIEIILIFFGLFLTLSFINSLKSDMILNRYIYLAVLFLVVIFSLNTLLGEKHLLGLIFSIYFLGLQSLRLRYLICLGVWNLLIGSYYLYDWMFVSQP